MTLWQLQSIGGNASDVVIGHQSRSDESLETSLLQGKRVVIVEDEGIIQMQLRKSLIRLGLKVVGIALNGDEGIEICLRERPDVIFMDINMPGKVNGLEATQRILAAYRTCIVMLTAYTEFEDEAIRIGACGYIVKPVDDWILRRHLRRAYSNFQASETAE